MDPRRGRGVAATRPWKDPTRPPRALKARVAPSWPWSDATWAPVSASQTFTASAPAPQSRPPASSRSSCHDSSLSSPRSPKRIFGRPVGFEQHTLASDAVEKTTPSGLAQTRVTATACGSGVSRFRPVGGSSGLGALAVGDRLIVVTAWPLGVATFVDVEAIALRWDFQFGGLQPQMRTAALRRPT